MDLDSRNLGSLRSGCKFFEEFQSFKTFKPFKSFLPKTTAAVGTGVVDGDDECYHRRMWHSIPLTLFWFTYFGSLGVFYPYFHSISARERRIDRHSSRHGVGDLAVDRHDRSATLGAGGGPDRRAHAGVGVSHAGDGAGLSRFGLCATSLVDPAGDIGAGARRHRGVSTDDFGESGDPARFRAPCVRPGARLGHHRLLYSGSRLSLGAARSISHRQRNRPLPLRTCHSPAWA